MQALAAVLPACSLQACLHSARFRCADNAEPRKVQLAARSELEHGKGCGVQLEVRDALWCRVRCVFTHLVLRLHPVQLRVIQAVLCHHAEISGVGGHGVLDSHHCSTLNATQRAVEAAQQCLLWKLGESSVWERHAGKRSTKGCSRLELK